MMGHYNALGNAWAVSFFPNFFWMILGGAEILFAVGLIFPRKFTALSAVGLAAISLLGAALYTAYAGSGILWAIIPTAVLSLIAYKRWS